MSLLSAVVPACIVLASLVSSSLPPLSALRRCLSRGAVNEIEISRQVKVPGRVCREGVFFGRLCFGLRLSTSQANRWSSCSGPGLAQPEAAALNLSSTSTTSTPILFLLLLHHLALQMAPSFFAFLSKRENASTPRKPSDPPSRSRPKSPAGLPPTPSTKSIPSPSIADRSEQFEDSELSLETDYVLADVDSPPLNSTNVYPHASSSTSGATNSTTKLRMPFRKKQPSSSKLSTVSQSPPIPPTKEHKFSVDSSLSESPSLLPPPSRSAIFGSYADPHNAFSTRSLPQHSHSRQGFQEASLHYETMSNPDSHSPSVTVTTSVQPKQSSKGSLFSWVRPRGRTKSKALPPDPSLTSPPVLTLSPAESFNLKSFRHVTSPETPPSSSAASSKDPLPRPRPRPRGDSFASDSSQQRISVAAFREAHARRSTAGSPVPSSSGDPDNLASTPVRNRRRSSALATPPSVLPAAGSQSRVPPARNPARNPPTRSSTAPLSFSSSLTVTSSESSDEGESESEEEATLRPSRMRTLTNRSAQSELGHRPSPVSAYSAARSDIGHGLSTGLSSRLSPPPRNTRNSPRLEASGSGSRALSVYSRTRASVSTSALVPDGAAKRVSTRIPKHSAGPFLFYYYRFIYIYMHVLTSTSASRSRSTQPPLRSRSRVSTSSSESSSESSSSEDAPLASLVPPQRPGSAMSRASGSAPRRPAKPLIDIGQLVGENSLIPPRPSEPSSDASQNPSSQTDSPAGRPRKTSVGIGERLSALASGLSGLQPSRSKSPDSASDSKDEAFTPPEIPPEKPRPSQSPIPSPQSSPMMHTKPASTTPLKSKANKTPSALRLKSSNTPKVDTQSLKLDSTVSPPSSSSTSSDAPIPHITPTPIRERQELPAFAVTSRPTSHATNSSVGTLAALDKAIGDADPKPGPRRAAALGIADQSPKQQDQQPQQRRQPPQPQEEPQTTVRVVRSVPQKSSKEEPLPVPRPHSRPRAPPVGVTVSNIHLTPPPSSSSASAKPSALRQVPGKNGAVVAPRKPFALRDRSPASSAGDSSSSRMPITPRDGSELGVTSTGRPGIGHRKRASVTFVDELEGEKETRERDSTRISASSRSSHSHGFGHGPPVVASSSDDEDTARDREHEVEEKRKERRRIEAKAAIEVRAL